MVAATDLVEIDATALPRLAQTISAAPPPPPWGDPHLVDAPAETVAGWTLLLSALNFCFWDDEPRWRVGGRDGYLALVIALRRAHDDGVPLADPRHWTRWSVDDLAAALRGDPGGPPAPPLLAERHAVARELGTWLVETHDASALSALARSGGAADFAATLAASLPGFRDVASWQGGEVAFLKRAQIAAADCAAALGGRAPAGLRDRTELTAFADYKVPQVLRHEGVLRYAPALADAVDSRCALSAGSEEEVAIRAATVVAVEALTAALRADGDPVCAADVDARLWWRGQEVAGMAPYHRVRTIWY